MQPLVVEEKKEKVISEREKVEVEMKRWEKQQQRKARQVISFAFAQEGDAGRKSSDYKRVFACIPCRKGFESKKKLDWHRRRKHIVSDSCASYSAIAFR